MDLVRVVVLVIVLCIDPDVGEFMSVVLHVVEAKVNVCMEIVNFAISLHLSLPYILHVPYIPSANL